MLTNNLQNSSSIEKHLQLIQKRITEEDIGKLSKYEKDFKKEFHELYKGISDEDIDSAFTGILTVTSFIGLLLIHSEVCKNHYSRPDFPINSINDIFRLCKSLGIITDLKVIEFGKWLFSQTKTIWKEQDINLIKMLPPSIITELIERDELGSLIQVFLPPSLRKALAANFTSLNSADLLANIAITEKHDRIIDPFAGSSRLLWSALEVWQRQNCINERKISIFTNEFFLPASFLSLARIFYWVITKKQKISACINHGDAFQLGLVNDKYKCVLMNPPFTRYLRLQDAYIKKLFHYSKVDKKYLTRQLGLHIFALFLADSLLTRDGRIASVLPAPTFYSEYSEGIKRFLLENYTIRFVIGLQQDKAFSEGSNFKEVLFIADKSINSENEDIIFAIINCRITPENTKQIAKMIKNCKSTAELPITYNRVTKKDLRNERNWLLFLNHPNFIKISRRIKESGCLRTASEASIRIVRGFEMYGPDFFFLPNNDWKITQVLSQEIICEHKTTKEKCRFPKEILIEALRRPGLYLSNITPKIEHFAIAVPPNLNYLVPQEYVEERRDKWKVAAKRFGHSWISHIHSQIQTKKPFGKIFLVDKCALTSVGTFCHFFDQKVTASKNFYILDSSSQNLKIMAAWLNSTLFLCLFLMSRREIGGSYGRLQIIDYKRESFYLNTRRVKKELIEKINSAFEKLRKKELKSLKDQLYDPDRRELDYWLCCAISIPEEEISSFLEELYEEISALFKHMDERTEKKRMKE